MSSHKYTDRICVVITAAALLITVLFMCAGSSLGIQASGHTLGYENRLFDTDKVHTLDIVMDDWDGFIENAASEEYSACSVIIDGESYKNIGIRGKGNTSLSNVASMDSSRYSLKLEFDHYESGKSYHGLDKLCLNNIIQDNTYMKDYLTYRLMNEFGVDAPLCSYVWVTVNGEDWGLFLAVEGIEDSFLERVYSGNGDLYKPDSMSFGGGPGNGRDFKMDDFMNEHAQDMGFQVRSEGNTDRNSDSIFSPENFTSGNPSSSEGSSSENPSSEIPSSDNLSSENSFSGHHGGSHGAGGGRPQDMGGGKMGGFGMGSDDVKLKYIDDDPESYSNIFDNAKTTVSSSDQARLISSLKKLNENTNLEDVLDIQEVLRYFVVHNYTVNGDSYTGSMIHNYYLHEEDGRLSMIPWDYNLAFGTFQSSDATSAVNDAIDSPLSISGDGSRPMADWFFQNEEYTQLYHQLFEEFLDTVDITGMIETTADLIAPYVEKDPTAFCTYEEFEKGVQTLITFCEKRTESIRAQLSGSIPSSDSERSSDSSALIDASDITVSDMGGMNQGRAGAFGGEHGGSQNAQMPDPFEEAPEFSPSGGEFPAMPEGGFPAMPDGDFSNMSEENFPDAPEDAFPEMPGMPGASSSGLSAGLISRNQLLQLSASVIVLTAGLIFAGCFKKRTLSKRNNN